MSNHELVILDSEFELDCALAHRPVTVLVGWHEWGNNPEMFQIEYIVISAKLHPGGRVSSSANGAHTSIRWCLSLNL